MIFFNKHSRDSNEFARKVTTFYKGFEWGACQVFLLPLIAKKIRFDLHGQAVVIAQAFCQAQRFG